MKKINGWKYDKEIGYYPTEKWLKEFKELVDKMSKALGVSSKDNELERTLQNK